jgi:hypothetical protein
MSQVTNFEYNDYTEELVLIPNQWGLITNLGLFREQSTTQQVLQFDETSKTLTLIPDQKRGMRKQLNKRDYSKLHTVGIPHFPFDDVLRPQDIEGRRMPGEKDGVMSVARARADVLERLRMSWADTMEYARMQALMGNVYNPNGTNDVQNWYTEMDVTQEEVDFVLDTTTTDVRAKIAEAIALSQDNMQSGEKVMDYVVIASPEFFASLISHAQVVEAYTYYASSTEPLRRRLESPLGAWYREFEYGGVRFIEYRGTTTDEDGNTLPYVPEDEAYLVPIGTRDTFVSYFAPPTRFGYLNTPGQSQYVWEWPDERGHDIEFESESNFIHMVRRPQAIIKLNRNT